MHCLVIRNSYYILLYLQFSHCEISQIKFSYISKILLFFGQTSGLILHEMESIMCLWGKVGVAKHGNHPHIFCVWFVNDWFYVTHSNKGKRNKMQLRHRIEMTTWIILKKGPHGKIMLHLSVEFAHIFCVTQVGLEKCAILLHVPKLVIISKGEYAILLSRFPRNENCVKLSKCTS